MTNYIRGMKRQQIIKKWLQGIDDPEFEVFPTKKEGKYIVKKRTESLPDQVTEESTDQITDNTTERVADNTTEEVDDNVTAQVEGKPTQSKKQASKPKSKALSSKSETLPTIPKRIRESNPADLTISYEILNQLKELGNELKQQRIKKEQKSMIKQVVQKQMTKRPNRKQIVKEPSDDNEEDEYEYVESTHKHKSKESIAIKNDNITEQPPPQPIFKSRIRR